MDERGRKGGIIAFMVALAGLLTAAGTLLNAAGAFGHSTAASSRSAVSTPWSTSPSTSPPAPAPSSSSSASVTAQPTRAAPSVDNAAAQTVQMTSSTTGIGEIREALGAASGLVEECAAGTTSACARAVLDLTYECRAGMFVACDGLYAWVPADWPLSGFAATCGYRDPSSTAGRCEDL